MLISKTTFQHYTHCPKDVWLKLYKPELHAKFILSEFELHIMEQGNEVESCARSLFVGGIEVASQGEHAVAETQRLMTQLVPTIFQATFIADDFIVRNDMLKYNVESGRWDLYEVKGTNSLKLGKNENNHVSDLAFQVSVMRRAHVPLGRYYLVHLNKEYVRFGDIEMESLFTVEDMTDAVEVKLLEIEIKMEVAREYLHQTKEPVGSCECVYASRRNHCSTFSYTNPHIPAYSVHDISRIHTKKLSRFIDEKVYLLEDIRDPDEYKLSDKQKNQVLSHTHQRTIVDEAAITHELQALQYPLYFFDYEAYAPAIPAFDGYGPYKFIPFQFSLHILRELGGALEHVEFLHEEFSDPSNMVAASLQQHIKGGTVVVWYQNFEKQVNNNIGLRLPEHAAFFKQLNASIFDLYQIFFDQHYIHYGFKGSASIKKVLPVIAPELTYADLEIHEGGQASSEWWRMVSPLTLPEEKKQIAENLKKYCGRDTEAMYVIWKHLQETIIQVV